MRRRFLLLSILVGVFVGCERSPYPGYKPLGEGLHYRLLVLGEGERTVNDSDRITLAVRASQDGSVAGSLYSSEQHMEGQVLLTSALGPLLRRLREGDSVSVWMPSVDVPWDRLGAARDPVDTGMVRLELVLRSVRSAAAVREEEAAYNAWRADRELEERAELERYLNTHGIDRERTAYQGIHILPIRPGRGALLRTGDLVTIAYVAHGIDGRVFDDTYKARSPLTFRLGDPGQVVRGLEIGLRRFARGSRGTLILPSQFAFGDDGSAGGIVPPFTTVIYELEVLPDSLPSAIP